MEEFISPPEAPVFQPTAEEFRDPVAYITKIRPVVVNTGICKIRPPHGWKPPFSIDTEHFEFTPRLQPLNELDARTRVKLNFMDNLAKFWELQGITFKIPNVDRNPLDLHRLFKAVTREGGFNEVTRTRKWVMLTKELGYENTTVAGSLRTNYEKYLYPYELFLAKSGKLRLNDLLKEKPCASPAQAPSTTATKSQKAKYSLRHRRNSNVDQDLDLSVAKIDPENPEFKKLAFTCPGPKSACVLKSGGDKTPMVVKSESPQLLEPSHSGVGAQPVKSNAEPSLPMSNIDPVSKVSWKYGKVEQLKCYTCRKGNCEDKLLLCDGCDGCYHIFCLDPPISSVPPGDWRCPSCVAKECAGMHDSFGFEQADNPYTLDSFGQKANMFKQHYFNQPPAQVPYSVVEKEFWRLASSMDDEVTVEYGADLHSSKHGSGFPVKGNARTPEQEEYVHSGWNLNNLPNLKGSVLHYVEANISGMKVPWLYVGMCFSCFCWHIEDHWSYSINYLHWGEPKTWYGVPQAYAEALEATMKEQAPELFEEQPDLLHHLVTNLSPSILMKNGIPVVRTDQCAGEFVVTFPRAYHAGFNQGFNFAEAVNFSLGDWLSLGRQCASHYQTMCRSPVFSHDELLCKMMADPGTLDLVLLVDAANDAVTMYKQEEKLQEELEQKGIIDEERMVFELMSDDERQCSYCRTTCFLSAVQCSCSPGKVVCSLDIDRLCACPNSKKTLRYRYTMKELHGMVVAVQQQAAYFKNWCNQVECILDGTLPEKPGIEVLRNLSEEGMEKGYSEHYLQDELECTIQEVEKLNSAANQIIASKHRVRLPNGNQAFDVDGLRMFVKEMESLPCTLPALDPLKERLKQIEVFQAKADRELVELTNSFEHGQFGSIGQLEQLIRTGENLDVEIAQLAELKNVLNQLRWVSETEAKLKLEVMSIETVKNIIKQGSSLPQNRAVESVLEKVKEVLSAAQDWEQKGKAVLKQRPPHAGSVLQQLLVSAQDIPIELPTAKAIEEALQKAAQWKSEVQRIQDGSKPPHFNVLKSALSTGRVIPVKLEALIQLETRYATAKAWIDRAAKLLLKKNSTASLLESILPRTKATFPHRHSSKSTKKRSESDTTPPGKLLLDLGGDEAKELERIHAMEREELQFMRELRAENSDKVERDEELKSAGALTTPVLYCFCRRPESGYMLQCELCNEWYHASCLHLPKGKQSSVEKDSRFVCNLCVRTRRPRLDGLVSLLISLRKVPVVITEGLALQCLVERAIAWQKKARQFIVSGNAGLEAVRQQMRRTEELKANIRRWRAEAECSKDGKSTTSIQVQLASSAGSVLQHYVSELEHIRNSYAGLSVGRRCELEDLLMEGDLLEVTMDEGQELWHLLQEDSECQAAFSKAEEPYMDHDDDCLTSSEENQKKRRSTQLMNEQLLAPPKKKRRGSRRSSPMSPRNRASEADNLESSGSVNEGLDCSEEILEEDEGECSVPNCLQPMADQISWVQCDQCQQWYHVTCVGLTREYVEKLDSYICSSCQPVPGSVLYAGSGVETSRMTQLVST